MPLLKKVCEFIILAPPSFEILENRLRSRASDSAEQIEMRLAKAKHELSFYRHYDYVVVNDDLETAAANVAAIIRCAGLRTDRLPEDYLK